MARSPILQLSTCEVWGCIADKDNVLKRTNGPGTCTRLANPINARAVPGWCTCQCEHHKLSVLTKNGISPLALSSSMALRSVSPRRRKWSSDSNLRMCTSANSPERWTEELDWKTKTMLFMFVRIPPPLFFFFFFFCLFFFFSSFFFFFVCSFSSVTIVIKMITVHITFVPFVQLILLIFRILTI